MYKRYNMNIIKRIFNGKHFIKKNKLPEKEKPQIEYLFGIISELLYKVNNLETQVKANRLFALDKRKNTENIEKHLTTIQ